MGAFFLTLYQKEQHQTNLKTLQDIELARQTIRSQLLGYQEHLYLFSSSYERKQFNKQHFDEQSQNILTNLPAVYSLVIFDANQNIVETIKRPDRTVEQLHIQNEKLPYEASRKAFLEAKQYSTSVFSKPFKSQDNLSYLVLHAPIFDNKRFKGTVAATIPIHTLLDHPLQQSFLKDYYVSIIDQEGKVWSSNSNQAEDPVKPSNTVLLDPPGKGLMLKATLYASTPNLLSNLLAWTVIGLSILVIFGFVLLYRYALMRTQAEKKLWEETKFRRAMEDSMITGMRAIDKTGRITYVNPAFCKMTGFRESELVGMSPPFPYWPQQSAIKQEQAMDTILAGQAPPQGLEVQIRRRDGLIIDARMYVSPLINSDGKQSGWMTSITDITEPRRIREQLDAAQRRFLRILEEIDAAVCVHVPDNPSSSPIFTNRLHTEWFCNAAPETHDDNTLEKTAYDPFEWKHPNNDKWYEVRRRSISWVDGQVVQMQIATDITSRKMAEKINQQQQEQLQFTSRLITLGELASSLAHELNQPLAAISNYAMGCVTRIRNQQAQFEQIMPILEKINLQAQRAGDVIRRIREFVKQQEPNRKPSNLHTIVEDAIELSRLQFKSQSTRIKVQGLDNCPMVLADIILIEQVLINLIKNGIEAMHEIDISQRIIEISVSRSKQFALIEVKDNGSGVPEEIKEKLFESFFTTKSEGMGMGLNICRTIIEYHQGQLWVEPGEPQGSIFKFTLPLAH